VTEQIHTTELAEFDQGWLTALEHMPFATLVIALGGLTRLGERPASLSRLAAIMETSAEETTRLLRQNLTVRLDGDAIHWDQPFPGKQVRRMLYVGDREIPIASGCAPDLFVYAAVLDVPFRAEETCPATGRTIRVEFVPGGYEREDPPETVTVLMPQHRLESTTGIFADIDTSICAHQPFLASADAAQPWVQAVPGARVFTVAEMFDRPFIAYYRDHLRPLIHTV
jgi:alkylmercury lyase